MENKIYTVLTTIHHPDKRIINWKKITGNKTIVIGDQKTPKNWENDCCDYFDVFEQNLSGFKIAQFLPENHYVRKNIGYLYAMKNGAQGIIDTDDDNFPKISHWKTLLSNKFKKLQIKESKEVTFKNIYTYFSKDKIPFWPRGYPLNLINDPYSTILKDCCSQSKIHEVGLWQCMVDGDPDVDAIHRLIYNETPAFLNNDALIFCKNNYCAFNSQNTLWLDVELFPLLYLPSTVSFRFTDILRSYIAQIIINSTNKHWGFYSATSFQERNEHNLMHDFNSEICMYKDMHKIFNILHDTVSSNLSVVQNLLECYKSLAKQDFIETDEILILQAWISDISIFLDK